jgi:hypothetical protein
MIRSRQKENVLMSAKYDRKQPYYVRLKTIQDLEGELFRLIEKSQSPMHEKSRDRLECKIEMLSKEYVTYLV